MTLQAESAKRSTAAPPSTRAQERSRDKPAGKVSLLHQYTPKARKQGARVTPIVIDDPYAADYPALLRDAPAGAKQRNTHEAEWHAPPKRPIEVLASTRDVVAGMFARRQIDKAMFLAARDYQAIYEMAATRRVKTVDPSMPPISGGRGTEAVDAVRAALHRLTRIEARLAKQHGALAVVFCREVLGQGLTIERAATRRGDGDKQRVGWWGGLFRRCLRELAEVSGFAVRGAYRNRRREEKRREAEAKNAEREERKR